MFKRDDERVTIKKKGETKEFGFLFLYVVGMMVDDDDEDVCLSVLFCLEIDDGG